MNPFIQMYMYVILCNRLLHVLHKNSNLCVFYDVLMFFRFPFCYFGFLLHILLCQSHAKFVFGLYILAVARDKLNRRYYPK